MAHQAYAHQALATARMSVEDRDARTASFMAGFPRLWKLPMPNTYKEVLWRLAVQGVTGAGGLGVNLPLTCVCGCHGLGQGHATPVQLRQHAFWECPVAQAVRQELAQGLGGMTVQQWQVWLLQKPTGTAMQARVWRVVALAALWAMDEGRRCLWSAVRAGQAGAVRLACLHARASFWAVLRDFTRGGRMPAAGVWAGLEPAHPFICTRQVPALTPVLVVQRVAAPARGPAPASRRPSA